jgi:PEP-CTERM motif
MKTALATLAAVAAVVATSAAQAQTTGMDFESFTNGTVLTNQYPGVVFASSGTTVEVSDYGNTWGTAAPKIACPLGDARGYCSADLIVNFLTPLSALSYLFTGDDSSGIVGTASFYGSGGLLAVHNLVADGNAQTAHADSFASAVDIVKLVIHVNDTEANLAGLGYDDFKLTLAAAVPEPETYALMLAGLGVIGLVARRRKG